MVDNNLPKEDEIPWYSYQVKLRELAHARAASEESTASDVIKIVISHLFVLNAGGIAAIPTISTFFGEKHFFGKDIIEVFFLPGIAFVIGEILALFCAFIAYINHLFIGGFVRASCEAELAKFDTALPAYQSKQNLIDIAFGQPGRKPKYYSVMSMVSFWAGVFCGFFSLVSFIAGCVFLTGAVHGMRGL